MKHIASIISLVIVALALFGTFSGFLVDEHIIRTLILSGFGFSALCLFFIFKKIMADGSQFKQNMAAQGRSPVFGVIAIVFTILLMVIPAFYKGIPATLHLFVGQPDTLLVTVLYKPAGFHGKACSGKLYLKEYSSFSNDSICGIEQNDWQSFNKDDKIKLIGSRSFFGFSYSSYQKVSLR